MSTENKFREFWIWGFKIGPDESISQNCSVHLNKGGSEWYDPVHHVIEYSAFEQLKAEIKQLKEYNDNCISRTLYEARVKQLDSEIAALKSDLKIVRETLEGQRDINDRQHGIHVKEVEKLKSKLKIAVEALKSMQVYSFYSKDMDWFHECNRYGLISKHALKEIEG